MNKIVPKYINYHDIGSYRQLLMGVGILGVVLGHICNFMSIESGVFYTVAIFVTRFVFTEGFLFLSGYGLYYSFSKDCVVRDFYKRRVIRLYVPFFLLSLPLYFILYISNSGYTLSDFTLQLTTLYFWVGGNYGGMWYVSLSLFLYLIVPIIYYVIYKGSKLSFVLLRCLGVFLFYFSFLLLLKRYWNDYYVTIEIGFDKIIFFLLGFLWGHIVKNDRINNRYYLYILIVNMIVYVFGTIIRINTGDLWGLLLLCNVSQKCFFIPCVCIVMNIMCIFKFGCYLKILLEWLGKYSLEIYIIHLHLLTFITCGLFEIDQLPLIVIVVIVLLTLTLCAPVHNLIGKVQSLFVKN